MHTLILHHDDCLAHDQGPRHPESAQRIKAVMGAVKNIQGTEVLPAPKAILSQVEQVHDPEFWQKILAMNPDEGRIPLDPDTFVSNGSIDAALRASGAACFAVDQLLAGKSKNAFCVTRPPGHHAEYGIAMGFCLINHVAVAAKHAMNSQDIERVAVLDFDVHHGNGSQAIFKQSPEFFYISSHQIPLYPGTGYPDEVGCGNILNLPLAPGTGSKEFRSTWSSLGLPALHNFQPDLILVSAGFDAHEQDPLGQIELQDEDFEWITREICQYAAEACNNRVVSVLEGGYNLDALANSSQAHVEALTAC
jgi:acetoin utilization deacetylase AcuC-like enzyme